MIVVARAAACNGPVDRVLGLLAQTMGRLDDAERHLGDAVEIATRMGDRPGMALCGLALAELLLERDGTTIASHALELLADRARDSPRDGRALDRRPGPG